MNDRLDPGVGVTLTNEINALALRFTTAVAENELSWIPCERSISASADAKLAMPGSGVEEKVLHGIEFRSDRSSSIV